MRLQCIAKIGLMQFILIVAAVNKIVFIYSPVLELSLKNRVSEILYPLWTRGRGMGGVSVSPSAETQLFTK